MASLLIVASAAEQAGNRGAGDGPGLRSRPRSDGSALHA